MKRGDKKGFIESDMLGWILLGLLVIAIIFLIIAGLTGRGSSAITFIKNLLRYKQ